jgi:propanol-preferring alcohol dehydrogenase
MKAMVLESISDVRINRSPLVLREVPVPVPADDEVLVRISACGVCHTELDEIEGRTPPATLPVIPGHQVIGKIEATGKSVERLKTGDRVGIAWIYSSCGKCRHCLEGMENLCPEFRATGRDANGGYAEYMTVPESSAFPIPDVFSDPQAAPLLCAGAVGYRSLKLAGMKNGFSLGLTGFGASAHLVMQIARKKYPASEIFVFARSGTERDFAIEMGAAWAGDTTDLPPEQPDCIIDTTPVWLTVVEALKSLKPGGRLVINAIRKEDADREVLTRIDYARHLWMEKEIKSVANVTRADVREFLAIAADIPVIPEFQEYELGEANSALSELKERRIRGAKVLVIR